MKTWEKLVGIKEQDSDLAKQMKTATAICLCMAILGFGLCWIFNTNVFVPLAFVSSLVLGITNLIYSLVKGNSK